jgi:hypothetical protein
VAILTHTKSSHIIFYFKACARDGCPDYNKIVEMISKEDFETGMRNSNSETIKYFTVEDVY